MRLGGVQTLGGEQELLKRAGVGVITVVLIELSIQRDVVYPMIVPFCTIDPYSRPGKGKSGVSAYCRRRCVRPVVVVPRPPSVARVGDRWRDNKENTHDW